ncbi:MAG TPA: NAD(P)H-hydrate dehydratase [Chitinophagaceae bacterium]|nr:NAD(P)H-hydrate dehydratase [Chitinophagaceae bacterium]
MKLLSAIQARDWDQYTIQHEPIASIDLMERAATRCVEWLEQHQYPGKHFIIFCGKGNNGGDGLAIARMLAEQKNFVTVYILESGHKGSEDFQINLTRLQQSSHKDIHFIQTETLFPILPSQAIIIDALFGSGLSRPLEGITSKLVEHINHSGCEIIAIDVPSGLFVDVSSKGNAIIKATHTLSIHTFKPAFLMAENAAFIGHVHIIDIGLKPEFLSTISIHKELLDEAMIRSVYKPRDPFAHKGNFGHALLLAGSYGKMGAAVLAAKACLRSGVGLITCHIPKCGYEILQTALPEAMVLTDFNASFITNIESDLSKYNVIGIGPGIGTARETRAALKQLLPQFKKPVVIDADGLNCISLDKELLNSLPPHSILTPHPKEFERLFGESENDFERIEKALINAKLFNCLIVLKGHHTFIATPSGFGYFNSTGNPGMAKGGSGDVLTGILTGLLAQGYSPTDAAMLGVYLHGWAGDIAANKFSEEAMIAGDITEHLGEAFLKLATA